jgi:hypothetical protein
LFSLAGLDGRMSLVFLGAGRQPERKHTAPARGVAMLLLAMAMPGLACDSDRDCDVGGTCIKREKRASGVCYGTAAGSVASPAPTMGEAPPKAVSGERRERAKAWMGDPEQMLNENLPGKAVGGVCMVTQDCPTGLECVIAGFEGHCMKP